ncbi:Titin [Manis pentadactyla]|nr:Titin [Manis pentadactyla]
MTRLAADVRGKALAASSVGLSLYVWTAVVGTRFGSPHLGEGVLGESEIHRGRGAWSIVHPGAAQEVTSVPRPRTHEPSCARLRPFPSAPQLPAPLPRRLAPTRPRPTSPPLAPRAPAGPAFNARSFGRQRGPSSGCAVGAWSALSVPSSSCHLPPLRLVRDDRAALAPRVPPGPLNAAWGGRPSPPLVSAADQPRGLPGPPRSSVLARRGRGRQAPVLAPPARCSCLPSNRRPAGRGRRVAPAGVEVAVGFRPRRRRGRGPLAAVSISLGRCQRRRCQRLPTVRLMEGRGGGTHSPETLGPAGWASRAAAGAGQGQKLVFGACCRGFPSTRLGLRRLLS